MKSAHKWLLFALAASAVIASPLYAAAGLSTGNRAASPPVLCNKDVCSMLFYYNRWVDTDRPVLNKYDAIVFNQAYQQLTRLGELDPRILKFHAFPVTWAPDYSDPLYGWAVIDSHEDWFLHNTPCNNPDIKECRIYDVRYATGGHRLYLMNLNNQEYLSFKISQYQNLLSLYPLLDGFWLDGETADWNQWATYGVPGLTCSPDNSCPAELTNEQAYRAMHNHSLQTITGALPQAKFIANSALGGWDIQGPNGELGEDRFNLKTGGPDLFYWENRWKSHVSALANPVHAGRIASVLTGASFGSQAWIDQMVNYTLGSFLLGKRADSDPFFAFDAGGVMNDTPQWFEVYSKIALGNPVQDYQITACTDPNNPTLPKCVYSRKFENGIVVVNPNFVYKTQVLTGRYRDLNGNVVTGAVHLPPHTAKILHKVLRAKSVAIE